MKSILSQFLFCSILLLNLTGCNSQKPEQTESAKKEKTAFQTSRVWKPTIDVRADVAIIYGSGDRQDMSFEQRVQSWRDRGYTTHFMTGIAWGGYQDYFTGKWDGEPHLDEGQVTRHGDTIWHGRMVPYIVPSENFLQYMKQNHIKRVIDAGIDAIYLEEPEFWARAGYSESFKEEWKKYYGFDWRPQHTSAENTYLSNKLKYHLYYRAVDECCTFAKEYGKSKGMDVRCYIPTHSLINYSQWMIVSPEASLASLPGVDGYIAQVWTGTSAEPNYFNGEERERVFETAYLEYGCMEAMTAPTGRKMFFLTDPIEDRPFDWPYYKQNYQATFTAQLLYPNIDNYEVMPWPNRIYEGLYYTSAHFKKGGGIAGSKNLQLIDPANADKNKKERIPRSYSTQMQVMINSLNQMPLSSNKLSGSQGISVVMANSLMFQRAPDPVEGYDDPQLSNFYGEALPLLKRGIPVKTLHIENASYPETWKDTKVLLMSYSNLKPLTEDVHSYIADWVKEGGVIVYSSRDTDPFQTVEEWWNKGDNKYERPADHLFQLLGIEENPEEGEYTCGKGTVYVIRKDPKEFILEKEGDREYVAIVKKMYEERANSGELTFKNSLYLERGMFNLIAVMDESVSEEPFTIRGLFIDLFDPQLPVITEKTVDPGKQSYLLDIKRVEDKTKPQVLAAASRTESETRTRKSYSFVTKSPLNTTGVMRVLLPAEPKSVEITDAEVKIMDEATWSWDEQSKTCLLGFENSPEGVNVMIKW
ncbi:MAG TPA: hypothetical protein VLZ28_07790 [Daejeonella sp.]|nr:hypothetical protein [Daejeonella sp.]